MKRRWLLAGLPLVLLVSAAWAGLITQSGPRLFTSATPANVQPSIYSLELVSPRDAGTAPSAEAGTPNFPAGHRVLKAYPQLEYNIKAVIIGGSYPYTCSLTGGVSWLSVDASTCVISGTAPNDSNGTTYTPTLVVQDAENTVVDEPWTITITTVGFKFVDCVNDGSGDTGAIGSPYDSLEQLRTSSSAGDITYFRTGTCSTSGLTVTDTSDYTAYNNSNGNWRRTEFNAGTRSVIWLAYPGETAVINGNYTNGVEQGQLLRMTSSATVPVYIDGLEITNFYHMALQLGTGGSYAVFRRLNAHDIRNSFNGANSAVIDSLSTVGTAPRYYVSYTENNIHDNASGAMKLYWQYKSLMSDSQFTDNGVAGLDTGSDHFSGGPDHKAMVGRFEVRSNVFKNCTYVPTGGNETEADSAFGGNMNGDDSLSPADFSVEQSSGEVRYNKFGCFSDTDPGLRVVDMNNFSNAGRIDVYRNTGVGRWNVQNSNAGDGPFRFYDNVIVNDVGAASTDRITFSGSVPGSGGNVEYGAGDDTNIVSSVAGAEDIIIDSSTLNLVGDYLQYKGYKGAELQ